jgi:phospholipid transport system substrate-binding protein
MRIVRSEFMSAVRNAAWWWLAAVALGVGTAQAGQLEPHQVVQQVTERVLAIVNEERASYEKAPERFHQRIEQAMDGAVDFDSFARGVMGRHASAQRYQALKSDAERAAFRAQVERFTTTFKQGLITTYAKGLFQFDGQRIETLPGRPGSGGSVTVRQLIHGSADKPYVVQYTMRQDRNGNWQARNVIIEGINLGQTYRNQFAQAVQQNRGDIDRVIDTWRVEPQTVAKNGGAG